MKRFLTKYLVLCLMLPFLLSCAAAEEMTVINTIRDKEASFSFSADAQLLEVYFPKVFGCDAALVRYGEYSMLIDCGGNQNKEVQSLLTKLGITELTYAINSHPDADHIGGFNRVLKAIPAKEFLLGFPEDYDAGDEVRFKVYSDLHALGIPFRQVSDGDSIEFGDVRITVHQRTNEHLPRVNNKSVMLMIEYGERRIFFTGDIQAAAQTLLAEESGQLDLKADILKFPHHGYSPMQDSFLDMVSPDLVICTCGENNTDGIKQLKERKIPYLLCAPGTLRLATDGSVWLVERIK